VANDEDHLHTGNIQLRFTLQVGNKRLLSSDITWHNGNGKLPERAGWHSGDINRVAGGGWTLR